MDITLPDFSRAAVLIIGDVMLDRYWQGSALRISPEAPVPVVNVHEVQERPGGAGNVALNCAALGIKTYLLALTGKDDAATQLERKLSGANIETYLQRSEQIPTTTKLRVISHNQQLIRLDFEERADQVDTSYLLEKYKTLLPHVNAVIISDYNKGGIRDPQAYIQLANQADVPVFVDPKGNDFSRYRGATVLTPNRSEFEAVAGSLSDETTFRQHAKQMIDALQLKALLVTRGKDGMTLLRSERPELHMPAHAREVYDVTGAGDTVISVFAATMAAGEPFEKAMLNANTAAGIAVSKLGAATISVPELRRGLQKLHGCDTGILNEAQLLTAVEDARAHGERIIMTNGCFDILHAGHIQYLNQAKKLGQRLIVAVNDDASVKRLKGDTRPINALPRRMAVLAALEAVDWVVAFSEDTPQRLIAAVLPDVLVKGGDYKVEDIAGGADVLANGGEVTVLPFQQGCSTTATIEKIQETSV